MDEFDLIARYFRPLTTGFAGGLALSDDAALIDMPPGQQLVMTTDGMSAGVHFLGQEDASMIARKLLRVNLSDLAAKGASPLAYFLTLALPRTATEAWVARFAEGLAMDQKEFGIHLAGGDTTGTQGPLWLSITALGSVAAGRMLMRRGARVGDDLYVSGTLGDAALGLSLLAPHLKSLNASARVAAETGELPVTATPGDRALVQRYLLPQPRVSLSPRLRGIASACLDVSDGLVQDAGHLCAASGVGATIEAALLPLSDAARVYPNATMAALTGGDDYELLFSAPAAQRGAIANLPVPCTRIGRVTAEKGVRVVDAAGVDITPARGGWRHFSG